MAQLSRLCCQPWRTLSQGKHLKTRMTTRVPTRMWCFKAVCSLCVAVFLPLSCARGAETASSNRVLELDGTNSFVELPAGAFTNLDEVTVEGWVKWETFGSMSRFFDFTLGGYSMNVMNRQTNSSLFTETLRGDDRMALEVPGILSLG